MEGQLVIETNGPVQPCIEILSANGQLVYQLILDATPCEVDLSSFQKGVCFITVRWRDYVTMRKDPASF
jgi:hypothetical protein